MHVERIMLLARKMHILVLLKRIIRWNLLHFLIYWL